MKKVDEYLAGVPEPAPSNLKRVRVVQGRSGGLLPIEGNHTLPSGQASAGSACEEAGEEAGEGADRAERAEETALNGARYNRQQEWRIVKSHGS
jgi:hypothetical protein